MQKTIDINCDMGESFGQFKIGNDEAIFPYISSCNIACGFHGGDPLHMENTIKMALEYRVTIGAHPSYPDLAGFGRRSMKIHANELKAILKYQIAALKGLAESLGGRLAYVKPHGALYNTAAVDEKEARTILQAIREIDPSLILMGLAGSVMEQLSMEADQPFVAEAFADRRYESNGKLMSRSKTGAVLDDPAMAARQVLSIISDQSVESVDGKQVPIRADTICIHGDNPSAIEILQTIESSLNEKGIIKKSFA